MSVWGPGPLENDDALDWLAELESEPSIVALNEAFDDVLRTDGADYLEVTDGAAAVCAAVIVAALVADTLEGIPLSEHAGRQLRRHYTGLLPSARTSLIRRALQSLNACADETRSELFELTHEAPAVGQAWLEEIDAMRLRLAGGAKQAGDPGLM